MNTYWNDETNDDEMIPMDCAKFEEIVADLERPGTRGAALREAALAHAELCARCAQFLTEAEALDLQLRCLATHDATAQAPARVEANLLREFRKQKSEIVRRRLHRQIAALGAAAAMLLAVGTWIYHSTQLGSDHAPARQAAVNVGIAAAPTQANAAEPSPSAVQRDVSAPRAVRNSVSATGNVQTTERTDAQNVEPFIPLPFADDPTALDDGAVVRVVMPRAALASFGLPMEAMEGSGTVRADLIVSGDGTPQAIRVLSSGNAGQAIQMAAGMGSEGGQR